MEKIYGVSSKMDFGIWSHRLFVFDTQAEADEWLETEEYDFRERSLMNRAEAVELTNDFLVEEAEERMYEEKYYRNRDKQIFG